MDNIRMFLSVGKSVLLEVKKNPLFKVLFEPRGGKLVSPRDILAEMFKELSSEDEEVFEAAQNSLHYLLSKPLKIGVTGKSLTLPTGPYVFTSQVSRYDKEKGYFTDYYQSYYNHLLDVTVYVGTFLPEDVTSLSQEQIDKLSSNSEVYFDIKQSILKVNTKISLVGKSLEELKPILQDSFYESLLNKSNPIDFLQSYGFTASYSNNIEIKRQGNIYTYPGFDPDEFSDILSLYRNCLRSEFVMGDSRVTFDVDAVTCSGADISLSFFLNISNVSYPLLLKYMQDTYSCTWDTLSIFTVLTNIIQKGYAIKCIPFLSLFLKEDFIKKLI